MWRDEVQALIDRKVFNANGNCAPDRPFFNPYHGIEPGIDRAGADEIRRENWKSNLQCHIEKPSILVIGEAPGWRGCRFSGIPFTSEAQITSGVLPFSGCQSSLHDPPYSEITATIFWQVMLPFHPCWLAWNCIPYHLYQPGKPLSNRTPTRIEISQFTDVLRELITLIKPRALIAVGNTARYALTLIDAPHHYVRHPSHGGAKRFRLEIQNHFCED